MKKSSLLRLLLSVFIIVFILFRIDIGALFASLKKFSPIHYLWTVGGIIGLWLLTTLNMKFMFLGIGQQVGFRELLKSYLKSYCFGMFTPGKVGEFSQIYFLKDEGIPYGDTLSVSVLNKLITLIFISATSLAGSYFLLGKTSLLPLLLVVGFVFLLVLLIRSEFIRDFIKRRILGEHSSKFEGFYKNLQHLAANRKDILALNVLITSSKWVYSALIRYFLLVALGVNVPLLYVIIINCIGAAVALIPISFSGLGVREGSVIYLFGTIGISQPPVAATYFLITSFNFIFSAIVVITYGKELIGMKEEVRKLLPRTNLKLNS